MSVHGLFNRPLNSVAHVDYLDLPGIITTQIQETDEQISVKAEEAEQMNKCPNCGKEETLKGDGSPSQGFRDRPDGKPHWVTLRKQIYECSVCHETCFARTILSVDSESTDLDVAAQGADILWPPA